MKINIVVHDPILISEEGSKIYKTKITHPKLDGELSFVHGESNRDETLLTLTNSLMEDINEIIETVKQIKTKK